MTSFLLASAAAGLAGFDPASFLIALAALGAGVRRRSVLTFTGIVVGGTALVLAVDALDRLLFGHFLWNP